MNVVIESFETARDNVFGDLISKKKTRKPLTVGLVTVAFFEYWRMYPGTLRENVTSDMTTVRDNLARALPEAAVVWPGLVDTLDAAEAARARLEEAGIDIILYAAGTYCPDYMAIQVLESFRHLPILMFNTQSSDRIDLQTNYENILRNTALIANLQLSATFRKMGWFPGYKVVVGSIHDEEAYREIARFAHAYKVYVQLKDINIGVVGHVFRGMYDFEYDKTMIKGTIGPNIIAIQIDHLLDQYSKATEEEILEVAAAAKEKFQIVGLSEDDIVRSSKLYIALRNTLQRFRLDALTLLGQHYVEQKTGTTSYLANTLMHEEGAFTVNTEGDMHGLIMMTVMNLLSGRMPTFAEWGKFDTDLNALLMVHHGYANPEYAADRSKVKVNRSPEQWGLQGAGFGFEYTLKPGTVTISHLLIDERGYKMLIMKAESLPVPDHIPCEEITAVVQFQTPIKELLSSLLSEGFAHHCIIGYGDMTEELSHIADFMGIRKMIYR